MEALITTLGEYQSDQLGLILPHEHIFVELSPLESQTWHLAKVEDVLPVMRPQLEIAREAGVTALVECTPLGVGRRADIVQQVSKAAGLPVLLPTGIYREPWVPEWVYSASVEALRDWMLVELNDQIGESGVRAGWIKLSANDDGLTEVETRILRAAAQASMPRMS